MHEWRALSTIGSSMLSLANTSSYLGSPRAWIARVLLWSIRRIKSLFHHQLMLLYCFFLERLLLRVHYRRLWFCAMALSPLRNFLCFSIFFLSFISKINKKVWWANVTRGDVVRQIKWKCYLRLRILWLDLNFRWKLFAARMVQKLNIRSYVVWIALLGIHHRKL